MLRKLLNLNRNDCCSIWGLGGTFLVTQIVTASPCFSDPGASLVSGIILPITACVLILAGSMWGSASAGPALRPDPPPGPGTHPE